MIGYMEGKILQLEGDRLLLLAGQVGYEILLPAFLAAALSGRAAGDELSLYIHFHQAERQPSPTLIGFENEMEKAFFQQFLSVEAIGPLKAARALSLPVSEIAEAIERADIPRLSSLKGIGKRTAQKIVASLSGRMEPFLPHAGITSRPITPAAPPEETGAVRQVMAVLTEQLGLKSTAAKSLVHEALAAVPPDMPAPGREELLDAVLARLGGHPA